MYHLIVKESDRVLEEWLIGVEAYVSPHSEGE